MGWFLYPILLNLGTSYISFFPLVSEITADDITQIWGSGDIEPGGTFGVTTDLRSYFYTTTEVSEFQTVWTIRTANQGTILCTFKSSMVDNQQTWNDIASGGGKPEDDATAAAESLCVNN